MDETKLRRLWSIAPLLNQKLLGRISFAVVKSCWAGIGNGLQ